MVTSIDAIPLVWVNAHWERKGLVFQLESTRIYLYNTYANFVSRCWKLDQISTHNTTAVYHIKGQWGTFFRVSHRCSLLDLLIAEDRFPCSAVFWCQDKRIVGQPASAVLPNLSEIDSLTQDLSREVSEAENSLAMYVCVLGVFISPIVYHTSSGANWLRICWFPSPTRQ